MKRKRKEHGALSSNNAFLCTDNNKEVYCDLIILYESSHLFEHIHL
ncbi:hypothetical protein [uncultured Bacteroides sp.]|nr:hypothetical protein [uncultured Bacteroides sp.]